MRKLDEGEALGTLVGRAVDLVNHQIDIPPRHDHQRNLTIRVRGAPLIDDEVVVRLNARQCELLVHGEGRAGEARHVREVQLCVHTLDVHVLDALFDVMAAIAHVVVGARVHGDVFLGATCNCVERKVAGLLAFEAPVVAVDCIANEVRAGFLELLRKAVLPNIGVLDHVIINADDLCVLWKHSSSSSRRMCSL